MDIGSPPTTFPLQLDIASSDLLLASTLCSNGCPSSGSNYPFYDAKKQSATFGSVNGNTTLWKSSFGDGTVASGFVALESINLGGVKLVDQAFGKCFFAVIESRLISRSHQRHQSDPSRSGGLGHPWSGLPPSVDSVKGSLGFCRLEWLFCIVVDIRLALFHINLIVLLVRSAVCVIIRNRHLLSTASRTSCEQRYSALSRLWARTSTSTAIVKHNLEFRVGLSFGQCEVQGADRVCNVRRRLASVRLE